MTSGKNIKEMSQAGISGKNIPGRGQGKCKGVKVECWQVRRGRRPVWLEQSESRRIVAAGVRGPDHLAIACLGILF